jgi:prepilin-type N-terminal cleavage/methylation domain-containing protein
MNSTTCHPNPHPIGRPRRPGRRAFTFIELMVVIALIVIVSTIALPSFLKLFSSGADAQAYNMMSAQLSVARADAVVEGKYYLMHTGIGNANDSASINLPKYTAYMAILVGTEDANGNTEFKLAPGRRPRNIPGNYAFGGISSSSMSGDNFTVGSDDSALAEFTRFSILFGPNGEVLKSPASSATAGSIVMNDSNLFGNPISSNVCIWPTAPTAPGLAAMALFHYPTARTNSSHINEEAEFMAINTYTGKFFESE